MVITSTQLVVHIRTRLSSFGAISARALPSEYTTTLKENTSKGILKSLHSVLILAVTISERFSMAILGCQKRITWNQLIK